MALITHLYNGLDLGRQVDVNVKEDTNADFNHFPLALTLAPDYLLWLKIAEMILMSKVFCERYHHPGLEGFLLRSGLDIDLEWDCPSLSGSSIMIFNLPEMKEHLHAFYLKDKNESFLGGSSHQ